MAPLCARVHGLACLGQLRLAPSGHMVGIDMDAALGLAAARGHNLSRSAM
jgi:hypothetical protein